MMHGSMSIKKKTEPEISKMREVIEFIHIQDFLSTFMQCYSHVSPQCQRLCTLWLWLHSRVLKILNHPVLGS